MIELILDFKEHRKPFLFGQLRTSSRRFREVARIPVAVHADTKLAVDNQARDVVDDVHVEDI